MDVVSYVIGKNASGGGGGGGDVITDYLVDEISHDTSNYSYDTYYNTNMIKKTPPLKLASEVTTLNYCFQNNNVYEYQFDKENFDTTNVTSMQYMFNGNRKITELDLSFFNTKNLSELSYMFSGCNNLRKLDLSGFTKQVYSIYMNYMFQNCQKLAVLDFSNYDLNNVNANNAQNIFQNCGNQCLQSDGAYADGKPYIYVKNTACQNWVIARQPSWTTDNVVIKGE